MAENAKVGVESNSDGSNQNKTIKKSPDVCNSNKKTSYLNPDARNAFSQLK